MKKSLFRFLFVLVFAQIFVFCKSNDHITFRNSEYASRKHKMDSIATHSETMEELKGLLNASLKTEDEVAALCFYRELGKRSRDSSDFQKAIYCHNEAVTIAKKLKDTLGIITMLNQQGTNYRRINAIDLASDCYYEAVRYADEYNGVETYAFLKNKVSSLNGLGNIFKDIDQEEQAESLFRRALEGEEKLKSHLGIAINTANIGSIFEHRGQLDSALAYYRRSFEENTIAKSVLGIALCYNHFGRIHEKNGQLDSSLVNYRRAYNSLGKDADKWHWLGSCISLARLQHVTGNNSEAKMLLSEALATAYDINSWYHLGEIYSLRSAIYQSDGEWKNALEDITFASSYRDSLEYEKQLNHIQNIQRDYLEKQNEIALAQEKMKTATAKRQRSMILWVGLTILLSLAVLVYLLVYSLKMRSRNYEARLSVEKARQEFFTNVTHDFRTPLTVIIGQANLIRSRNHDNDDIESAKAIIRQGDTLMELINQILDISKVKSSIGNADWRRGSILPLITMAVENARMTAAAKQIIVNYSHTSSLDGIEIDFVPDFMKKIFTNILSNALKYTGQNGVINVEASIENEHFMWKVSDSGIGISKDEIGKIFTPFYRTENALGQAGSGIGLSLVKQMVEAMDGSIDVESTEGKGSVFTICIPVHHFKREDPIQPYSHSYSESKGAERQGTQTVLSDDTAGEEKSTLLIVEDNYDIADYISTIFKDHYQVVTAINGVSGMSAIEEYMPDLIITDLMMPDVNGLEICKRVRSSEVLNHIPIVVVTAKDREEDRLASVEAGADAFLLKPFNAQELTMVVHNLLESRRLLREKYSEAISETEDISKVSANNAETDHFLSKLTAAILSDISSPDLSAEFIADKLCLSASSVNRKIKSITGMSTSAFITATKISMAKKMLTTTDKSIGEISDMCGFEYQSYFARLFKNQTGLTPVEYRGRTKQ